MQRLNRYEKYFLLLAVLFVLFLPVAYLTLDLSDSHPLERSSPQPTQPYLININTASLSELDELPYVGEVIGQRIIDYREEHGPFETIDELDNVSGITPNRINNFRGQIYIGPPA